MIKAVIFDFGGVISENCWDPDEVSQLVIKVLKKYGFNPPADYKKLLEKVSYDAYIAKNETELEIPLIDIIRKSLIDAEIVLPEDILLEIMEVIREATFCEIRKEAIHVLKKLKEMGIKTGILSNTSDVHPFRALLKEGLYDYIDTVILSCWVRFRKPNPNIFKIAIERLNVKPNEAIYVGDIPHIDVVGAKRAGLLTIWMKNGERYWAEKGIIKDIPGVKADYEIDELTEVIKVVNDINQNKINK